MYIVLLVTTCYVAEILSDIQINKIYGITDIGATENTTTLVMDIVDKAKTVLSIEDCKHSHLIGKSTVSQYR